MALDELQWWRLIVAAVAWPRNKEQVDIVELVRACPRSVVIDLVTFW